MANGFPIMVVPGKIPEFFNKIQGSGIPQKMTVQVVKQLGFKSSNDERFVYLLKILGFVDSSGVPTQRYRDYRDKGKARQLMGDAVKEAYASLYELYPDAHLQGNDILKNYFSTKTDGGETAVQRLLSTFKSLVSLADFNGVLDMSSATEVQNGVPTAPSTNGSEVAKGVVIASPSFMKPVAVNINIQLTLPDTKDPEVYDNLFKSLYKHILSQEKAEDA